MYNRNLGTSHLLPQTYQECIQSRFTRRIGWQDWGRYETQMSSREYEASLALFFQQVRKEGMSERNYWGEVDGHLIVKLEEIEWWRVGKNVSILYPSV